MPSTVLKPSLLGQQRPTLLGEPRDDRAPKPTKWQRTAAILNEYNPIDAFWRLADSPMASGGEISDQNIADGLMIGGTVMGMGSVVPKPPNALNMGIKGIKNFKGETVQPPRDFYRGTNPGSTERISTGMPTWDRYLFAADNEAAARNYGASIEQITAHPDAKILYEGTGEWNKIAGKWRKDENLLQYADRAAKAAKEAGYDAAWFKRQGDVGTAIINPEKFVRGTEIKKAEGK